MIANAYVFPTRFTLSFRIVSNEVVQFHRAVQTALSEMKMDTGESKHPASIAYAAWKAFMNGMVEAFRFMCYHRF